MKSTKKSNEKISLKREKIVVLGARTGVRAGQSPLPGPVKIVSFNFRCPQ
jgi:hypothetical protein